MRPRPHTVALVVAVLAAIGSLVVVPVATSGPDGSATPAEAVRGTGGTVDAVRPPGLRVVPPALFLLLVPPAVAGAAAALRRHAVAPAVVRAPGRPVRPGPVDGRAPPPGLPSLTR